MHAEVIAVLLAGLTIAAYFERKGLRADVAKVSADARAEWKRFVVALHDKELVVRGRISADVAKVVAGVKAEATKLEAEAKADVKSVEGKIEALVAKAEADLKKVL